METQSITRDALGWLITRVIGVLFLWLVLSKVALLIQLIPQFIDPTSDDLGMGQAYRTFYGLLAREAITFMLHGYLAYYFLRNGRRFHSLICSGDQSLL